MNYNLYSPDWSLYAIDGKFAVWAVKAPMKLEVVVKSRFFLLIIFVVYFFLHLYLWFIFLNLLYWLFLLLIRIHIESKLCCYLIDQIILVLWKTPLSALELLRIFNQLNCFNYLLFRESWINFGLFTFLVFTLFLDLIFLFRCAILDFTI